MPTCPTCSGPVDLATAASPPFCCDRCRLVDLGRWLDEAHSLPLPPSADDDGEDGEDGPAAVADPRRPENPDED